MQPTFFSSAPHPVHLVCRLVLALVLGFSFATAAAAVRSEPPHFPDAVHLANGCHLSTLAYLDRFASAFPAEHGAPLVVRLRNADGRVRPHTLALVTWQGIWWIRDEYFGVFALGEPATVETKSERFAAQVAARYARHVEQAGRTFAAPKLPPRLTPIERVQAIVTASALVRRAGTIFWVNDGFRETPVFFFRPAPGVVAVYDPAQGTAVADCASTDDTQITARVAAVLGYRVARIRAEGRPFDGRLVARTDGPAATAAAH